MKRFFKILFSIIAPISVFGQNSIFDNSEATPGAIGNLSQYASNDIDAVIYNPAGLFFSDKDFQFSLSAIGGYQLITNKPFIVSENGELTNEMSHVSSVIRFTPSMQFYYRLSKCVLSFSFANEGGGGVWRDKFGNEVMDSYFRVYESSISNWSEMQQPSYLLGEGEMLDLYSDSFESKCYNRCVRMGLSFKINQHFSGYVGIKANNIGTKDVCQGHLYVHDLLGQHRWLLSDYLISTYGLLNNEFYSDSTTIQQVENLITANSTGKDVAFSFAPVIGVDMHFDKLNIGLKYEMSPSLIMQNEKITCPHNLSFGVAYSSFSNLELSAGTNFQWGYNNGTLVNLINVVGPMCNFVFGFKFRIEKCLLSLSSSFGNSFYSLRSSGRCIEVSEESARFSLGLQYEITKSFNLELGISSGIPSYAPEVVVNSNNYFVSNGVQSESHCKYVFLPRVAVGLGVKYGF